MAKKPETGTHEEDAREGLDRYLKRQSSRLPRPKQKPSNRMLKPHGRTGSYETK